MLARCARCQGTFTTDHYGRNTCPHCGSELVLADPNAPSPPAASTGPEGYPPPPPAGGGWAPPPPSGGGWNAPPPPPPSDPGPELPAPFAERKTRGFFKSFFETWKLVATEPQKFFAHVRLEGLGTPLLFGVLAAWAGGAVGTVLNMLISRGELADARARLQSLPPDSAGIVPYMEKYLDFVAAATTPRGVLISVIAQPGIVLICIFLGAGLLHLLLLLFKGATRGFEATLVVVAFSYGVHVFDAIPKLGWLVSLVWQAVILIIGLAAIHRAAVWKSAVAVLAPLILCCCCIFGSAIAAGVALAGRQGAGVTNL